MEQNFNPGLALIGLSATGPRYTANGNRQIQEFLKVENELITVTAPKILMDKKLRETTHLCVEVMNSKGETWSFGKNSRLPFLF